ncbi:MAG: ABC transporter substrate-binding protein [Gammaproteobacteria bacterium]|nr:MAG: ABC transporter substrate-binding protein [Gammaproteobacteria bacterium]
MIRKLLSSLVLAAVFTAAGAEETAQQVVEQAVDRISAQLNGRREELAANKQELYALINRELLPKFDVDYAGRLVLGKAWRDATPAQRQRFVDVFYNFLLRSYATAILKFEQDDIRILPQRAPPQDGRTLVRTEMKMPDGTLVPVNYSMRSTPEGWKAYDVRIEGISYVQNYRNQFNAEVAAKGLDALIERLEKETEDIDSGRREPEQIEPTPGKKEGK